MLSLDSFNEARIRSSVPPEATPAIRALVDAAACGPARAAFPALTSPGHAALWTGSYGDVNGIAGNVQSLLPRDVHAVSETGSGFLSQGLRAEPIWVTAVLSGVRTAGHHTTQSPQPPGYPDIQSDIRDPGLARLRARADTATRSESLHIVNGYDNQSSPEMVITQRSHAPQPARWSGMGDGAAGDGSVQPLEVVVPIGRGHDSVFVLFVGRNGRYTHALLSGARQTAGAVPARPHAVESQPPRGRELARYFSSPLVLWSNGQSARIRARLFELAPDASRFTLFIPAAAVIAANHQSTSVAYDEATGGWVGNSAGGALLRGDFGPPIEEGGDGSAELRWLETAELATRTSIAGSSWMWNSFRPRLLLDYFALGDDTDHLFWGMVASPTGDSASARRAQAIRARAWALVDARVESLHGMARRSGAMLVLTGDHGMRPYWRLFRPNVALASAGLLTLDAAGRVIPQRSQALSPNGYWVTVNRTGRRNGVVPESRVAAIADSVIRVLQDVRDRDGSAVVTRVYRAGEDDSLGLGGPSGGDIYFDLADGYYYDGALRGTVTSETRLRGGHGYPSVRPDMHTVVCFSGPGIGARQLGLQRTIDVTPTVLDWLGVAPTTAARGKSLIPLLRWER